jgi:hypothetical protein
MADGLVDALERHLELLQLLLRLLPPNTPSPFAFGVGRLWCRGFRVRQFKVSGFRVQGFEVSVSG